MAREVQGTFELEPAATAETWTGPTAEVAVAVPILHHLTYAVPAELLDTVEPGIRVRVPIGGRQVTGFVIAITPEATVEGKLRPLTAVLEDRPCVVPATLRLGLWVARYYGAAPGESLQAVVPAAVRHGRRLKEDVLVEIVDVAAARAALDEHLEQASWQGRCRVLRALLDGIEGGNDDPQDGGQRLRELQRRAKVSVSPIDTLQRGGLVRRRRVPALEDPFAKLRPKQQSPPTLTADQATALKALIPLLGAQTFAATLLHGVTGSGKTEVYLQLLERTLAAERSAILLVPEIALTPQTVERILGRIPEVAVLHSNLSDGDRATQWRRLRSGEVRVAVGPRSAVFAPLANVGLIVLDEEHETTFKQQSSPRYHARDVALHRGRIEGALVVLGTATPSLETEGMVRRDEILRVSLPTRVGGRPMPKVSVIDMRHEKPVGPGGIFSRVLVNSIDETLGSGGQVMLFLNRRGFSTMILCRVCGWRASCSQCAIQLTHYRGGDRLLCHYCGEERHAPRECPDCKSPSIRYGGFGTERVQASISALFPEKRVDRMDGETLARRGAPERLYRDLFDGKIDILVGTQALAKGLDIPNVTLVGVVSADTALLIPDFRSSERTFQLLCQVAGRAGRGDVPGRVIIQSYCPDHESIQAARHHDHHAFVERELAHREALSYPPSANLARVVAESSDAEIAAKTAMDVATKARSWPETLAGKVTVVGPAPCPIPQLKGQHRFHLLLVAPDVDSITELLDRIPRRSGRRLRVLVDRDPVALM